MTLESLTGVVNTCTFRDWKWRIQQKGDGFLLQATFNAPDDWEQGLPREQRGRKWYVSSHSCRQEIVGVCWAAIKAACLHEAAEGFRYRGRAIFNHHIDPDVLMGVALHYNSRFTPPRDEAAE